MSQLYDELYERYKQQNDTLGDAPELTPDKVPSNFINWVRSGRSGTGQKSDRKRRFDRAVVKRLFEQLIENMPEDFERAFQAPQGRSLGLSTLLQPEDAPLSRGPWQGLLRTLKERGGDQYARGFVGALTSAVVGTADWALEDFVDIVAPTVDEMGALFYKPIAHESVGPFT